MSVTGSQPTDDRLGSAADVRRFVNDSIQDVARRLDSDSPTVYEFVCECGDLRCRRLVKLTLAEYDECDAAGSVRAH